MTTDPAGAAARRPRPFDLHCQAPRCGREFRSSRRDARTCSTRCRQVLARHEREQAEKLRVVAKWAQRVWDEWPADRRPTATEVTLFSALTTLRDQ